MSGRDGGMGDEEDSGEGERRRRGTHIYGKNPLFAAAERRRLISEGWSARRRTDGGRTTSKLPRKFVVRK